MLRRRFFTPQSIKDRDAFRPHVQAALKGIATLMNRPETADEERFRVIRSIPT